MIEEPFARGPSPIHRTNPGLRIILAAIYSFSVALIHHIGALTLALLFAAGLTLLARLPLRPLLKRLGVIGALLVITWLLVPLTHGGDPMARLGVLAISRSGVALCLQVTLKAITIVLVFMALVASMSIATLGHTLNRLGMPSKLVQLLLMAYRYIVVIEQEYLRLYRAAKMRNFQPAGNLHTYRTYAYMVGMIFVRASERAERVHGAMKCRGFDGRFHSLTCYPPTQWNRGLAGAMALCNLLLIGLELAG